MPIPSLASLVGLRVVDTSGNVAAFFDASRRLLLNYATSVLMNSIQPQIQLHGTAAGSSSAALIRWSAASAGGSALYLGKSRGAVGTYTIVPDGDLLGEISFLGDDGAALQKAVQLRAFVDGTPAAGAMPGRFEIAVSPAGSVTPQVVFEVTATQLAFFGGALSSKPTITGARSGGGALASLLTGLSGLGMVTDSTTAGPTITVGTTAPVSPSIGDLWVDTN